MTPKKRCLFAKFDVRTCFYLISRAANPKDNGACKYGKECKYQVALVEAGKEKSK